MRLEAAVVKAAMNISYLKGSTLESVQYRASNFERPVRDGAMELDFRCARLELFRRTQKSEKGKR